MKEKRPSTIKVVKGNIVDLDVDVIVNAANEHLLSGSGVCGAIFKAAGSEQLAIECRSIGKCPVGSAVITKGYNLKAKHIIHTVGPIYYQYPELAPKLLESAYLTSLRLAFSQKLESIAFPCISTGVYGYPKAEAARIAFAAVLDFIELNHMNVIFCCYDEENYELYMNIFHEVFKD